MMVDVVIICRRMAGMSDEDLANLIVLEWGEMRRERQRRDFIFQLENQLDQQADVLGLSDQAAEKIRKKVNDALTVISGPKTFSRRMKDLAYDMLEAKFPGVY